MAWQSFQDPSVDCQAGSEYVTRTSPPRIVAALHLDLRKELSSCYNIDLNLTSIVNFNI